MAYTTINKSTDHFNTKLYTGNGSTQSITGVGFQPDFVWIKNRTDAASHQNYDAIRGADACLQSNNTNAEFSQSNNGLTSFDSDGFSVGNANDHNGSGDAIVSWNWLGANGTASNTNGSITSTVSANTTAGFSIVSYTGTGSAGTVGHGLGAAPSVIWTKTRSDAEQWFCHWSVLGTGNFMKLDQNVAAGTNATAFPWNPQTNTFGLSTDGATNSSGRTYIAYCFAEKTGYSKFGSYTGNGNADGTFVYLGFKPAFLIMKEYGAAGSSWIMVDNKRSADNPVEERLFPDLSNAENTSDDPCDFLSNGFKLTSTDNGSNGSSKSYIYMAFAEAPLVGSNNVPCAAR